MLLLLIIIILIILILSNDNSANNTSIISTDEYPSLRIESSAIINLRGVSTKLNKYNAQNCFIFSAYPPFKLNAFDTTGPCEVKNCLANKHFGRSFSVNQPLLLPLWCLMSAKNQLLNFTISYFGNHNFLFKTL